jgi:hypothetical protein
MKALLLVLVALTASAGLADEWLRTVKITLEPPEDGQQIVNFRFTPSRTADYDVLRFECVYRQQFPWQNAQGRPTVKTNEPVAFTHRRSQARLVADLDFNLSFRAPVSHARLAAAFGADVFPTNAPVRIDRVRITAERGDTRLWEQELKVPGTHDIVARPPRPPPPPPPKQGKFGEIDLD